MGHPFLMSPTGKSYASAAAPAADASWAGGMSCAWASSVVEDRIDNSAELASRYCFR